MTPGSFLAIYFVVWWIVLFAVLPFGVKTQQEAGEITLGTDPSAPVRPMLLRKMLITTVIAAVLVGLGWWVVDLMDIDLAKLAKFFGFVAQEL